MSIFRFLKNIDNNKPIPVFGDGRQKRDFTYIDDIADGTIKCLQPPDMKSLTSGMIIP